MLMVATSQDSWPQNTTAKGTVSPINPPHRIPPPPPYFLILWYLYPHFGVGRLSVVPPRVAGDDVHSVERAPPSQQTWRSVSRC